MEISSVAVTFVCLVLVFCLFEQSLAGLLAEPADSHQQPMKPGDYSSNTVPAYPVQTETQTCLLDLSAELFGGVNDACGRNLDRSRCCPVLAAWLFAAHARSALQVHAPSPASSDLPMMPDDSQKCVNSLQSSLQSRNIHIPQPKRPPAMRSSASAAFASIRLPPSVALPLSTYHPTGTPLQPPPSRSREKLPEFILLRLHQVSRCPPEGQSIR